MLVNEALEKSGRDSKKTFDYLYESMAAVKRFGRTARFDFLTMVGKLTLANIEPRTTYMEGATGPFAGGCLLFSGSNTRRFERPVLEELLVELGTELSVGMQVLEDALCNWQKEPGRFRRFRG